MNDLSEIYTRLKERKGQIAVLVDPEKSHDPDVLAEIIRKSEFAGIDYFFVGGSTVTKMDFDLTIDYLHQHSKIPVVIFPGSPTQVSENANAFLYLSLISGRNPDFLIGHHVQSAREIVNLNLEIIPTGYILIDGERKSSVAYISQTTPIPSSQISIAVNTAIAGVLQGKRVLFFDAGSGAKTAVPSELIAKVQFLGVPVIVGGGIKSLDQIELYRDSGANVVVIGNYIEENVDFLLDIYNFANK